MGIRRVKKLCVYMRDMAARCYGTNQDTNRLRKLPTADDEDTNRLRKLPTADELLHGSYYDLPLIIIREMRLTVKPGCFSEELKIWLGGVLDVYEDRLATKRYLIGDEFSLVDFNHIIGMDSFMNLGLRGLVTSRQNVNRWCNDILAIPEKELMHFAPN